MFEVPLRFVRVVRKMLCFFSKQLQVLYCQEKYDIVKENAVFKYNECLQFFCLFRRKNLVHVKRGTISAWIR